jgi:hypothetical protein
MSRYNTIIATHKLTPELSITVKRLEKPIIVLDGFSQLDFIMANIELTKVNKESIILKAPGGNSYVARNIGISCAIELGAEIILITDSDCIVSENWEKDLVENMERTNKKVCFGYTKEVLSEPVKCIDYAEKSSCGFGTNAIKLVGFGLRIIPTCNVAYATSLFKEFGLFEEISGGDSLFSEKVMAKYDWSFVKEAEIQHNLAKSPKDLFKKRLNYGPFDGRFNLWLGLLGLIGALIETIGFFISVTPYIKASTLFDVIRRCILDFYLRVPIYLANYRKKLGLIKNAV